MRNEKGFTLLELLLSIAIIGILAGLSLPVSRTMLIKNDLDIATSNTVQTLRRAQVLSQAADGDTTWGVKIQSGSIVLFQGASYASRDSAYDETFDVPTSITPSGISETVFTKLSGNPQTTGTITLSTETDTKSITLNGKGMVEY